MLTDLQKYQKISNYPALMDDPTNYPFHEKKAERTVTFVCPILSGDYVYKMIFPAMALNQYSTSHKAYMVGIQDYYYNRTIDDYSVSLSETFIKESQVIVFPFLTYDLRDIFDQVRKANPAIKIVYCIDENFMRMPLGYPNYKLYERRASKDLIIENMRASDIVLVNQINLGAFLFNELKDRLAGSETTVEVMPCGFFPEITQPILKTPNPNVNHDRLRVGYVANPTHFDDISCLRDQMVALKGKYRDSLEIISFGWKGLADFGKGIKDVFSGIPFTYQRPVNFYEYHRKLADLQLDILMIPVKLKEDNGFTKTNKNYRKFIEAASLAIPVMATRTEPFTSPYPGDGEPLVIPDITGMLIEKKADWVTKISEIADELLSKKQYPEKLDQVSETAYMNAMKRFDYQNLTQWIERIF